MLFIVFLDFKKVAAHPEGLMETYNTSNFITMQIEFYFDTSNNY